MSINTAEQHWRHQLTVSFTANVEFLLRWVGCGGGEMKQLGMNIAGYKKLQPPLPLKNPGIMHTFSQMQLTWT